MNNLAINTNLGENENILLKIGVLTNSKARPPFNEVYENLPEIDSNEKIMNSKKTNFSQQNLVENQNKKIKKMKGEKTKKPEEFQTHENPAQLIEVNKKTVDKTQVLENQTMGAEKVSTGKETETVIENKALIAEVKQTLVKNKSNVENQVQHLKTTNVAAQTKNILTSIINGKKKVSSNQAVLQNVIKATKENIQNIHHKPDVLKQQLSNSENNTKTAKITNNAVHVVNTKTANSQKKVITQDSELLKTATVENKINTESSKLNTLVQDETVKKSNDNVVKANISKPLEKILKNNPTLDAEVKKEILANFKNSEKTDLQKELAGKLENHSEIGKNKNQTVKQATSEHKDQIASNQNNISSKEKVNGNKQIIPKQTNQNQVKLNSVVSETIVKSEKPSQVSQNNIQAKPSIKSVIQEAIKSINETEISENVKASVQQQQVASKQPDVNSQSNNSVPKNESVKKDAGFSEISTKQSEIKNLKGNSETLENLKTNAPEKNVITNQPWISKMQGRNTSEVHFKQNSNIERENSISYSDEIVKEQMKNYKEVNKDNFANNPVVENRNFKSENIKIEGLASVDNQMMNKVLTPQQHTLVSKTRFSELVQKITQVISQSMNTKITKTSFEIDGKSYGKLEIEFVKERSYSQGLIKVESEEIKTAVEKLLPEINEKLNQKGQGLASLDVEVNQKENQRASGNNHSTNKNDKRKNFYNEAITEETKQPISTRDYGYNTMEVLA